MINQFTLCGTVESSWITLDHIQVTLKTSVTKKLEKGRDTKHYNVEVLIPHELKRETIKLGNVIGVIGHLTSKGNVVDKITFISSGKKEPLVEKLEEPIKEQLTLF